jgi:hypothetical protein
MTRTLLPVIGLKLMPSWVSMILSTNAGSMLNVLKTLLVIGLNNGTFGREVGELWIGTKTWQIGLKSNESPTPLMRHSTSW